jgi:hypothetical protein
MKASEVAELLVQPIGVFIVEIAKKPETREIKVA